MMYGMAPEDVHDAVATMFTELSASQLAYCLLSMTDDHPRRGVLSRVDSFSLADLTLRIARYVGRLMRRRRQVVGQSFH
jgi:hypothetical protein